MGNDWPRSVRPKAITTPSPSAKRAYNRACPREEVRKGLEQVTGKGGKEVQGEGQALGTLPTSLDPRQGGMEGHGLLMPPCSTPACRSQLPSLPFLRPSDPGSRKAGSRESSAAEAVRQGARADQPGTKHTLVSSSHGDHLVGQPGASLAGTTQRSHQG